MHTKIMAHGTRFWSALDTYVPNLAKTRKEIRSHQPTVQGILGEER
jgi:predicted metal-dependent hydrolase